MSGNDRALDPRRVMIALADTTVAHAFARILEMRGHEAAVATSFAEAAHATERFDVLVGEFGEGVRGTGLDAVDVLRCIRAEGGDPVALVVASRPTDRDLQAILDLGVDDILDRPILPERLVESVEAPRTTQGPLDGAESAELVVDSDAHTDAAEGIARELLAWCLRCDIAPPTRARIGSAVSEAVTNACDHGARSVRLNARVTPRDLEVVVSDDGPGFDAVGALTRSALDARSGIGRMHCLAEAVAIRSEFGVGTSVTLDFRVTTTEFEEEDRIDLTDLDFLMPSTAKELLETLGEDPDAPVVLSPALAVVVGRLLMGPRPAGVLEGALRA